MDLHNIKKSTGRTSKKLRRGRGDASGRGNYSTKGLKGQKARSGFSQKAYFEGGQTPLFMRLPKRRGFKRYFKLGTDVQVVNLGDLERDAKVAAGDTINKAYLVEKNYIGKESDHVKILGKGTLTKSLTFDGIEKFSSSAREMIATAGGSLTE